MHGALFLTALLIIFGVLMLLDARRIQRRAHRTDGVEERWAQHAVRPRSGQVEWVPRRPDCDEDVAA